MLYLPGVRGLYHMLPYSLQPLIFFRSLTNHYKFFFPQKFSASWRQRLCCSNSQFYPHCVCVSTAAQLCPTLWDPMNCNLPGSSVHRIFQARILEWIAISCYKGSSWPRDRTHVSCISCIGRRVLYHWATWEAISLLPAYKEPGKQ